MEYEREAFGHNPKPPPIDCLELMGGAFAVKAFTQHKTQVRVLLLMDNVTAVTHINKMGGYQVPHSVKSCIRTVGLMSSTSNQYYCKTYSRNPKPSGRPGVSYCCRPFRLETQTREFSMYSETLGSYRNRSLCTYQIPRYSSWRPDPGAEAVDAFTNGTQLRRYAIPPFALVGKCLKQVILQQVQKLGIIAPVWETQPWYSLLLQLCKDFSVTPTTCRSADQAGGKSPPNPPSIGSACLN